MADIMINVPNSRIILDDAKAPLSRYLEAISAKSKPNQRIALETSAGEIKRYIEELSSKTIGSSSKIVQN
jgi:DNA anti-recombination protein RmuC